jgi:hypothetical protein
MQDLLSGRKRVTGNHCNVMPQSLSAVYLHAVFSTKERRPFLRDLALRESLHGSAAFPKIWNRGIHPRV